MKRKRTASATLLLLIIAIVAACSGEEPAHSEMTVPVPENIPYHDREHIPIDRSRTFEELEDSSPGLDHLYRYLREPESVDFVRLELTTQGSPRWFGSGPLALDGSRLILLDGRRDHLIEYNLETHEVHTIAGSGSGPGDIRFPRDLIRTGEKIHVAREDMYITTFNCQATPCEYDETVSIDFRPASMTFAGDRIAAMGTPDLQGDLNLDPPIRLLKRDGEVIGNFGDTYDAGEHLMVLWQFGLEGQVRYSSAAKQILMLYSPFPYLYLYDASTLELASTFELPGAGLPHYIYSPMERSIRSPMNDYSRIGNVREIRGGLMLIETMEFMNNESSTPPWDYRYDFYLLDPVKRESFYIGGYDRLTGESSREIFFTETGLVIYDHDDSSLYWAGI